MDRITYPETPIRTTVGRCGFTLIELLVVISIIALLVGILLPALGAARRTAQNSQCLSNIKQMDTAAMAFAADHRFHVQISSSDTFWVPDPLPSALRGRVAMLLDKPGLPPFEPNRIKDWASAMVPYMGGDPADDFEAADTKVSKVFICPSDPNHDVPNPGYTIHNNISGGNKDFLPISYGVNADATTYDNGTRGDGKGQWAGGFSLRPWKGDVTDGSLDAIRSTSKTMLFADCGTRSLVTGGALASSGNQLFYTASTQLAGSGLDIEILGTMAAVEKKSNLRHRIPLASNENNADAVGPADRHNDRINVAYADGHAASSGVDGFDDIYLTPHK